LELLYNIQGKTGGIIVKITKFEYYNQNYLVDNIRKVTIRKRPDLKIYENADVRIVENVKPEDMHICQYYVLEKDLSEIANCRKALLEFGVDMFKLKGFVRVYSLDDSGHQQVFDVLPPVIEISEHDGGIHLLCDGMHRLYHARETGSDINVIVIDGVNKDYPYYALPNEEGWKSLQKCSQVPDVKKNYRIENYKSLFRDFNTAFLNVTQPRTSSEPVKLKVQGNSVNIGV
jgi:hypothetical protein